MLAVPEQLRPAQLGVVFVGRVVLGHISATLVDLGQRGFVGIEEVGGTGAADWLLTDLRGTPADRGGLLPFEATLLRGLFARENDIRLTEITPSLVRVLDQVRAKLIRDAVRRGWLRRWHRDVRTERGEQLRRQALSFRQELRALAAASDDGELAGYLPYAMIFGLRAPAAATPNPTLNTATLNTAIPGAAQDDPSPRRGPADPVPGEGLGGFAGAWLATCASLPPGHGHGHAAGPGQSGDFAHQWSAPAGHGGDHGSHGHGGNGGFDGGLGGHAGGHASGLGGHH